MVSVITFTSDFGYGAYVAQVKGAMLAICPGATIVDVTHDIAPGDVREAAYILEVTVPRFAAPAAHLAVIDPGVGTARRAIAVSVSGSVLVGPDNGVFTAFLDRADDVREIRNEDLFAGEVSATFYGRDVFGPVTAHIAGGLPLDIVGPSFDRRPVRVPDLVSTGVSGVILHVDRFGNLITSFTGRVVPARLIGPGAVVSCRARTFGEAPPNTAFLYAGSGGRLEVGVRNGSAAAALGWGRGTVLSVEGVA